MVEKVSEVCKVSPQPGSPTDDINLPLTFFDLFNFIFPPVELLFFYKTPPHLPQSDLLWKLKRSLSLTLKHFLPIAGYLVWEPHSSLNPIIRYQNGDGVLLTVTQSDADFYHLSGKEIRASKIFTPLIAQIVRLENQVPITAFKITFFPTKGICIGVTVHHAMFDSTSTTLLMNSWASFFKFGEKGGLCQKLTPVFDRKFVRELYPKLESSCLEILKQNGATLEKAWSVLEPERLVGIVRGTFILSRSDVRNLKELVSRRLKNKNNVSRVSTFAVTYAYVVQCLVQVKPPKNDRVNVAFSFDCRDRLQPRLPKNYFGNCVGPRDAYFSTKELLGSDGMALIVKFISKSTERLDKHGALEGAEEWLPKMFSSAADRETMRIFVAGSNRFELQSVDFGWGRPRKADIALDGTGAVIFTQGGDENKGGIEVELSLNECEIKNFGNRFKEGLNNLKNSIMASL